MSFQLGDHQEVDVSVTEVDHAGNPTSQTAVTFTSSDESVITVEDHGDASCTVRAAGPIGSATLEVAAGSLTDSVDFDIVAEEAETLNAVVGEPREQA